jgi:hypothetical protein
LEEVKHRQDERNAPIVARLTQIAETRARQERKFKLTLTLSAETDDKADDTEVHEMLRHLRDETATLLRELREEEDELRTKRIERTLSQEYITNWLAYAERVKDNVDNFTFAEKHEAIDFLGISGVLKFTDRRRNEIYVFDVFADEQPLEELVTDSQIRSQARRTAATWPPGWHHTCGGCAPAAAHAADRDRSGFGGRHGDRSCLAQVP